MLLIKQQKRQQAFTEKPSPELVCTNNRTDKLEANTIINPQGIMIDNDARHHIHPLEFLKPISLPKQLGKSMKFGKPIQNQSGYIFFRGCMLLSLFLCVQ